MTESLRIADAADPYAALLPERVTHATVVGVFGIFIGVLGLISLPFAVLPNWSDYSGIRGGVSPDHSLIALWGCISTAGYCGLCLMALVGGTGCLRFREWARPMMLGYGLLSVLMGIAGVYVHWRIIDLATRADSMPTFGFRFTSVAEWGVWIYGTIFGAYVMWAMLRPEVKEAFARGRPGGHGEEPAGCENPLRANNPETH